MNLRPRMKDTNQTPVSKKISLLISTQKLLKTKNPRRLFHVCSSLFELGIHATTCNQTVSSKSIRCGDALVMSNELRLLLSLQQTNVLEVY